VTKTRGERGGNRELFEKGQREKKEGSRSCLREGEKKRKGETVFIVPKEGEKNHPRLKIGKVREILGEKERKKGRGDQSLKNGGTILKE